MVRVRVRVRVGVRLFGSTCKILSILFNYLYVVFIIACFFNQYFYYFLSSSSFIMP